MLSREIWKNVHTLKPHHKARAMHVDFWNRVIVAWCDVRICIQFRIVMKKNKYQQELIFEYVLMHTRRRAPFTETG